ncbi:hypothetical protein F4781DRAFT_443125 [Annulohypoxylon bovei var. microspora]|nr:hypothetical protein F4781DRAFT_443125 [Annulohypoxylon bovei var. microspora]
MPGFRNILIIGASGSFGSVLLSELQKESGFTLTILQRASSKFQPPAHLKRIDVIINCMSTLSVAEQHRMIDAAITAGVKRYVPSEYGLNNKRPDTQGLNVVFHDKGKIQEYLQAKAAIGAIEWMSIACGMWLKWGMAHDFVGMHVREARFVFWDDGEGYFSCTTEENTAADLVRALTRPEETKNQTLFLSDFAINQKQLLAAVEKIHGVKYATESVNSEAFIRKKQEAVRNGDYLATYALIETGFATGRFGGHLEKEPGEILNEKLGLPKHTLDEVVTDALKALGII